MRSHQAACRGPRCHILNENMKEIVRLRWEPATALLGELTWCIQFWRNCSFRASVRSVGLFKSLITRRAVPEAQASSIEK